MIYLKDTVKPGMKERFDELRKMGIRTVMVTGDNPITAKFIAKEAGVDDFIAEATPEDKMAYIKKEQAGSRLVAMTGDGTNDAPALAQADVGVAMNTGTQAAKEAGNMVDLDSDPTKLIDIVEIGKQLLITRGSLTTFSIANDVAKYFAIVPAMFLAVFPQLDRINIMDLSSPRSAILSAVIFNALIIVLVDPSCVARGEVRAIRRGAAAAPEPHDLRARWDRRALHRDQAHRHARHCSGGEVMRRQLLPAIMMMVVFTLLLGLAYPLVVTAVAQTAFPNHANGSKLTVNGKVVGSKLLGQTFTKPKYFQGRPSAAGAAATGSDATDPNDSKKTVPNDPKDLSQDVSSGSNLGPTNPEFLSTVKQRAIEYRKQNGLAKDAEVPVDAVTASASGLDPHISVANARIQAHRIARVRGMSLAAVNKLIDQNTDGRSLGFLGEPGVNVLELNVALDQSS